MDSLIHCIIFTFSHRLALDQVIIGGIDGINLESINFLEVNNVQVLLNG